MSNAKLQKQSRAKRPKSRYKPVFTDDEFALMQSYGVGSLLDEIGVNRVLLLRMLHKMNQEMDRLSFRDHLDALRAAAYTTGHIAHQLQVREKLLKPYLAAEREYTQARDDLTAILREIVVGVLGQAAWDELEWDAVVKSLNETEIIGRH